MKSITIHGMDDELDQLIRKKAAEEQKSLNKTIKGLLEEALGVRPSKDHREEFSDLFGTWSTADRQQFEQATEDLRRVDPEDWK
ncbi:MAG: antitoxin [Gemmatimonadetes bacterium]|nr:antitoxin [Gemmatimonadota bacterium]